MEIKFSNDEVKRIITAYAEKILNVEIDDSEEVTCELSGYSSYNVTATVSIERKEVEPLKAVA